MCPDVDQYCNKRHIKGHYAKMCKTSSDSQYELLLCPIISDCLSDVDWLDNFIINNSVIYSRLDTGARCNVISKQTVDSLNLNIQRCSTNYIVSFSDHKIEVLGEVKTLVKYNTSENLLTFKVVRTPTSTIIGYESLMKCAC